MKNATRNAIWIVLALPAMAHLGLLAWCIFFRFSYPYDLEWMEGGMLQHALRVGNEGLYVPPSVDFIPYPYPPLFAWLVAGVGSFTGISYQVGRSISVMGLVGSFYLMSCAFRGGAPKIKISQLSVGLLAIGTVASMYPWVEGWYDIARVDMVFVFLLLLGLCGIVNEVSRSKELRRPKHVVLFALVLTLSFFAKQTGALFVAAASIWVLAWDFKKGVLFVTVSGCVGAIGVLLLNWSTEGWFWTYCFEVMSGHPFSWERFFDSFTLIAKHEPALIILSLGVLALSVFVGRDKGLNRKLWGYVWLATVATTVGAMGWGKSWAHFNAYIPAFIFLALAGGTSVLWLHDASSKPWLPLMAAGLISVQLISSVWSPLGLIPEEKDVLAGDLLIKEIASIEGEVFIPFHPWYGHLAGKKMYLQRMPVLDVSHQGKWPIHNLRESLADGVFERIYWDNRGIDRPFQSIHKGYRLERPIEADKKLRVFSGAGSPSEVKDAKHRLLVPTQRWGRRIKL